MKKRFRNVCVAVATVAALYAAASMAAKKMNDEEKKINADNPYRGTDYNSRGGMGIYEGTVKPILDRALSFGGLVLLLPLFATVSVAIRIDDPGPIFFTQKRIGKDKTYFWCHKFRTMKMSAPHDVPTHQLEYPVQYITRVGRILRKTSLDELPQFWDIFRTRMSVIGPRPALWNQDDLVEERDKYGANGILPGLTGLAQIKGRDELEIPEKARFDGEYVKKISFLFDAKCFFETIFSVAKRDGIVEGGTGKIHKKEQKP